MVRNDALQTCHTTYAQTGKKPSAAELSRLLTARKRDPDRAWLTDVSSVPLQQVLADLDRAWRNYFTSVTGARKGPRMRPPGRKRLTHREPGGTVHP